MPTWKNILTEASTSATNLTSIGTLTTLSVDNITVNGNTISATNTNGNVKIDPNGTGCVEIMGDGTADGTTGAIQLNCSVNSHGVKIQSPAHSTSATYTLTLPINDGDANQFLQTDGSGVLSWDDPAALTVAQGGTGATSFADKAVLITQDSGTDTVSAAAMSSNGQLLIGGTSGPAVATLTAGSNVTITNADGAITIASSGGGGGSGIASVSEDTNPTLGGDLIVGSNDIKSVGDVEVVVDSDNNTTDSSFTVKNGAGTVLFSVNESGITSGLLTTATPTATLGSSFQQAASVTGTVDNFDSSATYVAKIFNSGGTEQTSNAVTISDSGGISFTAPSTVASGYELRISAAGTGKLISDEVVKTFAITAATTFAHWRLQGVDSSGNNTADKWFLLDVVFWTGQNASGTEYPTSHLTSDSGGGINVTSGYAHSATYDDWKAFDDNQGSGHWTLGNSTANNNWLQVEFTGGAVNVQSIYIKSNTTYTDMDGIKVMGSSTGNFSGEEVHVTTITGNDSTATTTTNL